MKNRTSLPIIIVILILLAGGAVWYWTSRNDDQAETQLPVENLQEGQIVTVRGTIVCLPHKNTDGPQTMECAMGLKSSTNEHYALTEVSPEAWQNYGNNQIVDVTGSFTKAGDDEKYAIVGTIKVETVTSVTEGEPTGTESEMQGYTNSEYGFSFEYSANFLKLEEDENARLPWSVDSSRPGRRLVTVQLPKGFEANTNFIEGTVSVGISNDTTELAACLLGDQGDVFDKITINGTVFTRVDLSDAGAGNFYETKSYRVIRDKTCLALETTVHSTNLSNYSSEQGVNGFDKAKVDTELNEVIQ